MAQKEFQVGYLTHKSKCNEYYILSIQSWRCIQKPIKYLRWNFLRKSKWKLLTIFTKSSIVDVWQGSKYSSDCGQTAEFEALINLNNQSFSDFLLTVHFLISVPWWFWNVESSGERNIRQGTICFKSICSQSVCRYLIKLYFVII